MVEARNRRRYKKRSMKRTGRGKGNRTRLRKRMCRNRRSTLLNNKGGKRGSGRVLRGRVRRLGGGGWKRRGGIVSGGGGVRETGGGRRGVGTRCSELLYHIVE